MQRASPSIAALAAALAKAQAELINPEKSLVGTIKSGTGEGANRAFRYASLSSGLDIVRKTLGQHEIATVQTTAIDQAVGNWGFLAAGLGEFPVLDATLARNVATNRHVIGRINENQLGTFALQEFFERFAMPSVSAK